MEVTWGGIDNIALFLSCCTFKFLSASCPTFMSISILFCSLLGLVDCCAILNLIEIYVPMYTSYIK